MVRRFVSLSLSACVALMLGLAQTQGVYGQEKKAEAKAAPAPTAKEAAPAKAAPAEKKAEAAKTEPAPKADASKKAEPKKEEPKEAPLPPIPPEVQAKLEAARKAVAEAIVAAQDAGLVESSIDPPPILDILITGRAIDARAIKGPSAKKPYAVSPEVFAAWFTGYGKIEGVNYVDDVRILNPSAGLKEWYDQRARMLDQYIQQIRKSKGAPAAKKAETPAPAAKTEAATKK